MSRTTALTATGRLIDVLHPDPALICIEDIARALSRQCRFNGSCRQFFSVAEHSWLVSVVAEQLEPCDPLQALLHDSAEAYLGDVITPLKNTMPDYRDLEEVWLKVIAEALDFHYPLLPSTVEADAILVQREGVALVPNWAQHATPAALRLADKWSNVPVHALRPESAYRVFMDRYLVLKGRMQESTLSATAGGK